MRLRISTATFIIILGAGLILGCGGDRKSRKSGTTPMASASASPASGGEKATPTPTPEGEKIPEPKKGCNPVRRPAPSDPKAFVKAENDEFVVRQPTRDVDVLVSDLEAVVRDSVTTLSRKPVTVDPEGGRFVLMAYTVKNEGKNNILPAQIGPLFLIQQQKNFYGPSFGCQAAIAYITNLDGAVSPGTPVEAGKTARSAVAYVLPDPGAELNVYNAATGRKIRLTAGK